MIVREALNDGIVSLGEVVRDRAMFEARLLLSHVMDCEPLDLIVDDQKKMQKDHVERYQQLLERRSKSEPVAYLTCKKEFYGLEFFVDSRVLIPRPETEELVEGVIRWVKAEGLTSGRILDLGTGSGCIALTLAQELGENFQVEGIDISDKALRVAKINQERLGLKNVTWKQWDILESPREFSSCDVLVSNPPYIPTSHRAILEKTIVDFEPKEALFAGPEGIDFYSAICEKWKPLVKKPGLVAIETLDEEQRQKIHKNLEGSVREKTWTFGPHIFWEID